MRPPLLGLVLWAAVAGRTCALKAYGSRGSVQQSRDDPPDWREAAANAREISELSDKIQNQENRNQRLYNQYDDAGRYYDAKIENLEEQIRIRKRMVASHPNVESAEYKKEQEEHYQSLMCSMMMEAWVLDGGRDKKVEVMHICMGREDFALLEAAPLRADDAGQHRNATHASALESNASLPAERSTRLHANLSHEPALEANLTRASQELRADTAKLFVLEGNLERSASVSASQRRGPDEMRARLRQLEAEEDTLWAKMQADKARWTAEVERLQAEERALGEQHTDNYTDKAAIKRDAREKVKMEMCSVVYESYGHDDPKITRHVLAEC